MVDSPNFDRQAFIPRDAQGPSAASQIGGLLGILAVIVAIGVVAFFGYKFAVSSQTSASAPQNLSQMQQQLADMQKRLDVLEKRHKGSITEPAVAPAKTEAPSSSTAARPPRPAYDVYSASAMKPMASPSSTAPRVISQTAQTPRAAASATDDAIAANHEAWEATTDRLADVVGVVGAQQGELIQTRDQLNELLSQTQRTAMQFELRRGSDRQPIGPVSLVLKGSDAQRQRYTMCVYVSAECIELKDRSIDEVVTFAISPNSAPLELVATKVSRDAVVGYLEVPKK